MSLAAMEQALMEQAVMEQAVMAGGRAEALDAIAHRDTALAIWERDTPSDVLAALATVDLDEVSDINIVLAAGEAPDTGLHEAGYPDAAIGPLAADIMALGHRHAALTGTDRLTVRLEVVETDGCRRFHADLITLRMICTYIGPATQWHRVETPVAIGQLQTGAVGVLKGRLLLDPPIILHRSPPIMAGGAQRLVLVIDPA